MLRDRIDALTTERDKLVTLIDERRPWGDFKPPNSDELGGLRMWLYRVPNYHRRQVENSGLTSQIVAHDDRHDYVVVIATQEPAPELMPVPPLRVDDRSLSELEARLEDVELALADAQLERQSLSRWCLLLARSLNHLDDQAALEFAQGQTRDADPVFALQAWIPRDRAADLQAFAANRELVVEINAPDPSEVPPTRFENPKQLATGEDLVMFYMTPSYWLCDPSPFVFFSFILFFAMIMSDAGYGLLLAIVTLGLWKRMGKSAAGRRWRVLCSWLSGMTIGYGVLAGSYFGFPPPAAFLKRLQIIDVNNYSQMMLLAALIGVVHVTIANLLNAWHFKRSLKLLAPVGWAIIVTGGATLVLGSKFGSPVAAQTGKIALASGFLLVFFFTAADQPLRKRLVGGLLGLTRITSAFGDVLSYLRLFALGLASAALAAVFNDMANSLYQKSAGFGLLVAILILLIGHTLNLVLSLSSGFIHGLRLNVIEFFNWGVQEEGNAYKPFMRKENLSWES